MALLSFTEKKLKALTPLRKKAARIHILTFFWVENRILRLHMLLKKNWIGIMTPQPPQPYWDIGAFPSIFWILSSKKEGLTT